MCACAKMVDGNALENGPIYSKQSDEFTNRYVFVTPSDRSSHGAAMLAKMALFRILRVSVEWPNDGNPVDFPGHDVKEWCAAERFYWRGLDSHTTGRANLTEPRALGPRFTRDARQAWWSRDHRTGETAKYWN